MGPLQPDPTELVLGLIVFFVTFAVLGAVLLPRIERLLAQRRDATEGRAERAEAARAQAEQTLADLRKEQADAQREAARIRQEAAEQGAELIAAARAEGQRQREELIAEARDRIALDRELAEIELRTEIGTLATELAGRVVGEPLAEFVDQRGTVDRFFAEQS